MAFDAPPPAADGPGLLGFLIIFRWVQFHVTGPLATCKHIGAFFCTVEEFCGLGRTTDFLRALTSCNCRIKLRWQSLW